VSGFSLILLEEYPPSCVRIAAGESISVGELLIRAKAEGRELSPQMKFRIEIRDEDGLNE